MRTCVRVAVAAVVAAVFSVVTTPVAASAHSVGTEAVGFRVADGRLVEANGNDFVLRGVNYPHAWFTHELDALSDIKALGANAVRVVLSSGDRWRENTTEEVAEVVAECRANRLICVLEVHDTTGYGEDAAAAPLSRAVDYWLRVRQALAGQENHVLLNIGNEPFGNQGFEAWTGDTTTAVGRLRDAGFDHTLVVDAPNWGQDHTHTMRDNAAEVFASDPARNTVFSVHMYGVYDTAWKVRDYLTAFTRAGLPIMVGEFGHRHSDGDPDEDAILATTRELGVGYLGWSWSGNSGGVDYLDLVRDFDPARLTDWGRRLIHGPDGIGETADEAAIYR